MVVSKGGKTRVVASDVDEGGEKAQAAGAGGAAEGALRPRKATLTVLSVALADNHTVVQLQLTTGRLHQIRVQVWVTLTNYPTLWSFIYPRQC